MRLQAAHPDESLLELVERHPLDPRACYVKGRLQPTRSFGDLHLKAKAFSPAHARAPRPAPFNPPYITASPEVSVRRASPEDAFVVVASDGLWDHVSSHEAVALVGAALARGGAWGGVRGAARAKEGAAQALVDEALRRAGAEYGLSLAALKSLAPGRARRERHDDITVVVIFLK